MADTKKKNCLDYNVKLIRAKRLDYNQTTVKPMISLHQVNHKDQIIHSYKDQTTKLQSNLWCYIIDDNR